MSRWRILAPKRHVPVVLHNETLFMKISDEALTHYLGLLASPRYLPIGALEDACLYLIHARNSHIGQWCAAEQAFVIWREKFGEAYLAKEYHWDAGSGSSGTAKPFVKLSEPIVPDALPAILTAKLRDLPYPASMVLTRPFLKAPAGQS